MENQQPDSATHEDMDDKPTKETSEPQTTSDEPAMNQDDMGEKYMSGSENDRS